MRQNVAATASPREAIKIGQTEHSGRASHRQDHPDGHRSGRPVTPEQHVRNDGRGHVGPDLGRVNLMDHRSVSQPHATIVPEERAIVPGPLFTNR